MARIRGPWFQAVCRSRAVARVGDELGRWQPRSCHRLLRQAAQAHVGHACRAHIRAAQSPSHGCQQHAYLSGARQVLTSPTQTRSRTLFRLRTLLTAAERERVYLDITGNLAWRPERVPEWYEQLSERSRWQVQANFCRAVAHTAGRSPAVLCYELTSEPVIDEGPDHYLGDLDGWTFVQSIAERRGAVLGAWRVLGLANSPLRSAARTTGPSRSGCCPSFRVRSSRRTSRISWTCWLFTSIRRGRPAPPAPAALPRSCGSASSRRAQRPRRPPGRLR